MVNERKGHPWQSEIRKRVMIIPGTNYSDY